MNTRTQKTLPAIALLATLSCFGLAVTRNSSAVHAAQSTPSAMAAQSAEHETTMNDQTDLAVTVYNSNVALVRDTRDVSLPNGDFQLRFMDIASTIMPATVHFRSLADPGKLSVLEQNYEYDLLDANKVLDKYVGREVTMLRAMQKNGSTE